MSDFTHAPTARPHRRTGEYLPCAECGATFYRPKNDTDRRYCSRPCRDAGMKKHGLPRVCRICGAAFVAYGSTASRQVYCSRKCKDTGHYSKRLDRAAVEAPRSTRYRHVAIKKELRATVTACQDCGWDVEPAVLELHHRDGDRTHNTADNLALFCPNCHTLHHYRTLSGQFTNNLGRRQHND